MANKNRIGTVNIDRQKIMAIAAKKELTTADIRAALEVSATRTSIILSGEKPIAVATAKRLAAALGCEIEDIITA